MNAKLIAEAVVLLHTEERMQRVGLVVDRTALSAQNRRAMAVLQCLASHEARRPAPVREPIGFAYPNAH
ncbi:MAG TPA: hypothetical protein VFX03_12825 [Thermomicrobiales bacterium]|nr:hypothetical protein [Thermomicrobiales bacterium]